MKYLVLLVCLVASGAYADDNYIIPGARQEGKQTAVVARATTTGTTSGGNPLVVPHVIVDGAGSGSGVETPAAFRATTNGTVAAGARSVTFITSQATPVIGNGTDFAGSILGVSRAAGESVTITAQAGNTLAAMVYTISAGSLDIITTR